MIDNKPTLATQVVLITGAARRIGAEIAIGLHQAGMNVIVHHHRSAQEAQTLVQKLNVSRADSAHAIQADLLAGNAVQTLSAR